MPFAAAISGPANLAASLIARDTADLYRYLTQRIGAITAIHAVEVAPILRRFKHAGTLMDGLRLPEPIWSHIRSQPAGAALATRFVASGLCPAGGSPAARPSAEQLAETGGGQPAPVTAGESGARREQTDKAGELRREFSC